jgi:lipoate-protein ligase A
VRESPTRLALFSAADGATNFARDRALHVRAATERAIFARVYAWSRPVLSFGRNERVIGRFDPAKIEAAGLSAVRRPTGGRALLHHREITYAVAGPAGDDEPVSSVYQSLNRVLKAALATLGVESSLAPSRGRLVEGAPCFAEPAAGELTVDGRKLVASAQWRSGSAFLQHGSILIDNDQPLLLRALADGVTLPDLPAPATLRDLLPRVPSPPEFALAFGGALAAEYGAPVVTEPAEALLPDDLVRTGVAEYHDPAWTWRR